MTQNMVKAFWCGFGVDVVYEGMRYMLHMDVGIKGESERWVERVDGEWRVYPIGIDVKDEYVIAKTYTEIGKVTKHIGKWTGYVVEVVVEENPYTDDIESDDDDDYSCFDEEVKYVINTTMGIRGTCNVMVIHDCGKWIVKDDQFGEIEISSVYETRRVQ